MAQSHLCEHALYLQQNTKHVLMSDFKMHVYEKKSAMIYI